MESVQLFFCGFLQHDIKCNEEIDTKTLTDTILRKPYSFLDALPIYCTCNISKDTKFALTKTFLYYTYGYTLRRHRLKNSLAKKEGNAEKYSDAEIVNTEKTGNQLIETLHAGSDFVTVVIGNKDGSGSITLVLFDDGCSSTVQSGENNVTEFMLGKTFGLLSTRENKLNQIESRNWKDDCISIKPLHLPDSSGIHAISCGKEHAIVLTSDHKVFTIGGGSRGQLGNGSTDYMSELTLVESLDPLQVQGISAGGWHSLVLSGGDLYGWGWNESGQVGPTPSISKDEEVTEESISKLLFHPVLVDTPIDETFVCMSTGTRHSAAVTSHGVLYTWGWNAYGQLCHGDQNNRFSPCRVTCFDTQEVTGVQCSDWATLVITVPKGLSPNYC